MTIIVNMFFCREDALGLFSWRKNDEKTKN